MNANKIRAMWKEEDKTREIVENTRSNRVELYGKGLSKTLLYEYQKGVLKNSKQNYLYTLDVGTGKTFIGLYHYLLWKQDDVDLFIVAPSQKVEEFGWEKSIRHLEKLHNISINYNITSYDKFKKIDPSEMKNYYVILDECHMIKGYKSERSKNTLKLLEASRGYCLLSATPYSNGDMDLLVYLKLFNVIPDIRKFLNRVGIHKETPYSRGFKILTGIGDITPEKEKLKVFCSPMLRLVDCVELPELIENTIFLEPSKEVRSLKKFKRDNIKSLLPLLKGFTDLRDLDLTGLYEKIDKSEKDMTPMEKLFERTRTHHKSVIKRLPNFRPEQLLSLPGLNTLERQLTNLDEKTNYVKMFREESNSNIVIFYNYNIEKDSIIEGLKQCENFDMSRLYEISGKVNNVPFDKTDEIKNSTILVQYKAGGAGIELQFANQCIFYSPTYSYQDFYQAIGRVYRNGQKEKTMFHYLVTEGTIEEKIYHTIVMKQDFTDDMSDLDIVRCRDFDDGFKFMSFDAKDDIDVMEKSSFKTSDYYDDYDDYDDYDEDEDEDDDDDDESGIEVCDSSQESLQSNEDDEEDEDSDYTEFIDDGYNIEEGW